MEAGKAGDAYGLIEGNCIETTVAVQAYVQSKLGGKTTWIRLPENRWPKHWIGKYNDPVIPLVLALYGHPDSGGYWERHGDTKLKQCGFTPIAKECWRSCYMNTETSHFLTVC